MALSRRSFLTKLAKASAVSSLAPAIVTLAPQGVTAAPSAFNRWPGRCAINYNKNATSGNSVDQAVTKTMMDDAIKLLTGAATVGEAWKAVCPASLSQTTTIAVKVNTIESLGSHPYLVKAITDGLQQMSVGGSAFPAGNIYIYDDRDMYSYSSSLFGAAIHLVPRSVKTGHGNGAWNNTAYSDTLYQCDLLINVPVLKLHEADYGGVTVGFKNHIGTYVSGICHAAYPNGQQCIGAINCVGPVFDKTVLTVICAIQTWGPSCLTYGRTRDPSTANVSPNTLVASTDPVTADFQAVKIVRLNSGLPYGANDMPNYLKSSAGITGIYSPTYNIGVINEGEMDVRNIVNGQITGNEATAVSRDGLRLSVHPNPGRAPIAIDYVFPGGSGKDPVVVEIFDSRGRLVQRYRHTALGVRNGLFWDGLRLSGRPAAAGSYVIKAGIAGRVLTQTVNLVR